MIVNKPFTKLKLYNKTTVIVPCFTECNMSEEKKRKKMTDITYWD